MKRIIAALLSLTLVFSFASCDKKNAEPADQTSGQAETESAVSVNESEEEEQTEIIYDFKGLDSEKAITVLTSSKYHIRFKYDIAGQFMHQDVYFDTDDIKVHTEFMDTKYDILYKDNVQYTIIDDIYYRMPADEPEDLGSSDMFEGFGYIGSGETELDGVKYKYDEYYQTTTNSTTKFLMTDSNELYALQSAEKTMYIEKYDADFDSSAELNIPENTKELSADEFNTVFLQKVAGNTAGLSEESSSEATPEE